MSTESAADRLSFLDSDEFADAAIVGTGTRYQTTINGLFDNEYIEAVSMNSLTPTFLCRTSDLTNIKKGYKLTVNSTDYEIVDPQQDGTGMTLLILGKQ